MIMNTSQRYIDILTLSTHATIQEYSLFHYYHADLDMTNYIVLGSPSLALTLWPLHYEQKNTGTGS